MEGSSAQLAVHMPDYTMPTTEGLYPAWKNSLSRETLAFLSAPQQTGVLSLESGHLLSSSNTAGGDGAGVLLAPRLPFHRDLCETRDAHRSPGLARGLRAVLAFPAPCTCVGRMEGPRWACGAR